MFYIGNHDLFSKIVDQQRNNSQPEKFLLSLGEKLPLTRDFAVDQRFFLVLIRYIFLLLLVIRKVMEMRLKLKFNGRFFEILFN